MNNNYYNNMVEEYSYIIETYIVSELYELIEDKTSYISHLPNEILCIIVKFCGDNAQQLKQINSMKKLISFVKDYSIYTDYFYMEILLDTKMKCIVNLTEVNYYSERIIFSLLNPRNYSLAGRYLTKLKIYHNVEYINFINEKNKYIIEYICRDNNNNTINYISNDLYPFNSGNKARDIYIKPLCFPVPRYDNNKILDIIKRINIKND